MNSERHVVLWQRVRAALAAAGALPPGHPTPSEIAGHARLMLDTRLVHRFVDEYYVERQYGGGSTALSDDEAETLVDEIESLVAPASGKKAARDLVTVFGQANPRSHNRARDRDAIRRVEVDAHEAEAYGQDHSSARAAEQIRQRMLDEAAREEAARATRVEAERRASEARAQAEAAAAEAERLARETAARVAADQAARRARAAEAARAAAERRAADARAQADAERAALDAARKRTEEAERVRQQAADARAELERQAAEHRMRAEAAAAEAERRAREVAAERAREEAAARQRNADVARADAEHRSQEARAQTSGEHSALDAARRRADEAERARQQAAAARVAIEQRGNDARTHAQVPQRQADFESPATPARPPQPRRRTILMWVLITLAQTLLFFAAPGLVMLTLTFDNSALGQAAAWMIVILYIWSVISLVRRGDDLFHQNRKAKM